MSDTFTEENGAEKPKRGGKAPKKPRNTVSYATLYSELQGRVKASLRLLAHLTDEEGIDTASGKLLLRIAVETLVGEK